MQFPTLFCDQIRPFSPTHCTGFGPEMASIRKQNSGRWCAQVRRDVKQAFGSAEFLADNRVVFDISGNNYRFVASISYPSEQVLVKSVGAHAE